MRIETGTITQAGAVIGFFTFWALVKSFAQDYETSGVVWGVLWAIYTLLWVGIAYALSPVVIRLFENVQRLIISENIVRRNWNGISIGVFVLGAAFVLYKANDYDINEAVLSQCRPLASWIDMSQRPLFGAEKKARKKASQENSIECYEAYLSLFENTEYAVSVRTILTDKQLRAFDAAMNLYKQDNYEYPSTSQGLIALVEKPDMPPPNWKEGGYLDYLPLDPWEQSYQYRNPGIHGKYDIYSLGPEKKTDVDDIGNWMLK